MKELWNARKSQIVNIGSGFFFVYCLVGYFLTFLTVFVVVCLFLFVCLFVVVVVVVVVVVCLFFVFCFLECQRNPCMKIPKAENFEQIITLHKCHVSCE